MKRPILFPLKARRIFVAGHRGMVGSALVRRLAQEECRILTVGRDAVDLRDQRAVDRWFDEHRPEGVLLAAARVGSIYENDTHPGDFLYDNLTIATNVIEASRRTGVAKLLFLGSSCIYPRLAPQPMPESCLLTGPLEPTNEWYAIAKIAGLKLCQAYTRQHGCDFVSVMPTNLYGRNDNFDLLKPKFPANSELTGDFFPIGAQRRLKCSRIGIKIRVCRLFPYSSEEGNFSRLAGELQQVIREIIRPLKEFGFRSNSG